MAETDFKYDVFVSYNSANKEWVRKIFVPVLEKAGLKVFEYYRDFDAGAPIVKGIEAALLESRKTISILSPGYLKSEWTDFESLMIQTLGPANRERRFLPVILETCELPLHIKFLNCINFANPDDMEIEWQRLSRALGVTLSPPLLDDSKQATGSRETWNLAHPYPMPPNFTGRKTELEILDSWLADNENRLFILRALGGFGKSALAWQWINTHVNPTEWTKLVFWSFYEGDASFEHFIEETLKYLKLEVPQGQRPQVDALLKAMQSKRILLIMDGFERALRAYSSMNAAYQGDSELPSPLGEGLGGGVESGSDCVNLNAEIFLKSVCSLPNIKSKVLMTTRLTPRAIKPRGEFILGCHEIELTSMQPADVVEFFRKQKIKGTHAEIEAACAPYGYHPLSLRLLAGRILKDFENPADIVAAQKLKIDGKLKAQRHHVLEVSYKSLPLHEQKLLSMIACFRSRVEHKTLQAIAENKDSLEADLHDLIGRGLLHFDEKNKKFDLHPLVRRYAYSRLKTTERTRLHQRLCNYFEAVPKPQKIEKLDDLVSDIELYHHMVNADRYFDAIVLYRDRIHLVLYFRFGASQTQIEILRALFIDGENNPPRLEMMDAQAYAFNELANAYALNGQPKRAVLLFERKNEIRKKMGDKEQIAIGLGNVGIQQRIIGALTEAEQNQRRAIDLCRQIMNEFQEAIHHQELGRVLAYRGVWHDAEQELDIAFKLFEKQYAFQSIGVVWSHRALLFLLLARSNRSFAVRHSSHKPGELKRGIECARRAINLIEQNARMGLHVERDFVRAHWLLGAGYYLDDQLNLADHQLSEALIRDRVINMVDHEANILLDLARLRYNQKNYEEARSLAEEALLITERCGYVLQGADVNLFLAELSLTLDPSPEGRGKARQHAETALKLAYCDGPPYYYKVAYHEAERMLEQLK